MRGDVYARRDLKKEGGGGKERGETSNCRAKNVRTRKKKGRDVQTKREEKGSSRRRFEDLKKKKKTREVIGVLQYLLSDPS